MLHQRGNHPKDPNLLAMMRQAESGGVLFQTEFVTRCDFETGTTGRCRNLHKCICNYHHAYNELEPYRAGIMALATLEFQWDEQGNVVADLGTSERKGSVMKSEIDAFKGSGFKVE
jgi:hypothetical protein